MTTAAFGQPIRADGSHPRDCHCGNCRLAKASRQAAAYRRRLRTSEQNTSALLGWYISTWLRDPRDFDTNIGRAAVTDPSGRIDFDELARRLRQLVTERPYLAALPDTP